MRSQIQLDLLRKFKLSQDAHPHLSPLHPDAGLPPSCPLASLRGPKGPQLEQEELLCERGARMCLAFPGTHTWIGQGQCCAPLAHHQQHRLRELMVIRASRAPRSLCYLKGIENNWKEDTCLETVPCQLRFLHKGGSRERGTYICLCLPKSSSLFNLLLSIYHIQPRGFSRAKQESWSGTSGVLLACWPGQCPQGEAGSAAGFAHSSCVLGDSSPRRCSALSSGTCSRCPTSIAAGALCTQAFLPLQSRQELSQDFH